jgi:hypothetical protein
MQQEYGQRAAGLGPVQRQFEGPSGGGGVAQRVHGDGLHQEGLSSPRCTLKRSCGRDGVVDDWAGCGDRATRVALGEPQYRGGDTHLTAFAVWVVEFGQGLLDLLGFAEAHQGLQEQSPGRHDEVMRHDEAAGQCLGGAETG